MRTRTAQLVALVAAVVLLVGSVGAATWAVGHDDETSYGRFGWGSGGVDADEDGGWHGHGPGSMMGDADVGMMGWDDWSADTLTGSGPVDEQGAQEAAQRWVDTYAEGAELGTPATMPVGYWFRATDGGTDVAVIMVDEDTGTVVGRLLGRSDPADR